MCVHVQLTCAVHKRQPPSLDLTCLDFLNAKSQVAPWIDHVGQTFVCHKSPIVSRCGRPPCSLYIDKLFYLPAGGLIAIVVVIGVVILTLMLVVLVRAVYLYRNKDKPIHQHRYCTIHTAPLSQKLNLYGVSWTLLSTYNAKHCKSNML